MLRSVRHTPLLNEYLPITELSQQRFAWVYTEIRNRYSFIIWLDLTCQLQYKQSYTVTIPFPVQNGSSSVQNGNSSF